MTQEEYDDQNRPSLRRSIPDVPATRSDQNTSFKFSLVFNDQDEVVQVLKSRHTAGTDLFDPFIHGVSENFLVSTENHENPIEDEYYIAFLRAELLEHIHKMRADLEAQALFARFETNMYVRDHNVLVAYKNPQDVYIKDQKRGFFGIISMVSSTSSTWLCLCKVSGKEMAESGVGNFN